MEEEIYKSFEKLPDIPTNKIIYKKVDEMIEDLLKLEQSVEQPLLKFDPSISCVQKQVKIFLVSWVVSGFLIISIKFYID